MPNNLLLYHDLILAIVAALEARDFYTASHSSRVAEMTEAICDYSGIGNERKTVYHIAAHLHDLGKIGVDDSILRKTERLTCEEWEKMKAHAVIGYTVLHKLDSFGEIASIVRGHHERWDGRGYPDGLRGEGIPIGSRIIAVADSIDAMLSARSYRGEMSASSCREEIEKNAGAMYDPQFAGAALAHWEDLLLRRNAANSLSKG